MKKDSLIPSKLSVYKNGSYIFYLSIYGTTGKAIFRIPRKEVFDKRAGIIQLSSKDYDINDFGRQIVINVKLKNFL